MRVSQINQCRKQPLCCLRGPRSSRPFSQLRLSSCVSWRRKWLSPILPACLSQQSVLCMQLKQRAACSLPGSDTSCQQFVWTWGYRAELGCPCPPGLPLPCVGESVLSAADSPDGFIWISPGCNLKVYYSLPSCLWGYIYLHFYWRILKYIHAYSIISWYKGTYLQNRKGLRFREWPYGCLYTLLHLKWITNKDLP